MDDLQIQDKSRQYNTQLLILTYQLIETMDLAPEERVNMSLGECLFDLCPLI